MKIISAPFGNYLNFDGWVPTIGTFTPRYRGGLFYRLWRCARTLRWDRAHSGWVNRLGLPNPGIDWLARRPERAAGKIVSLALASDDNFFDFIHLLHQARRLDPLYFEFNLSCPNERQGRDPHNIIEVVAASLPADKLILKLPPDQDVVMSLAETAREHGIYRFHCCNTIPTSRGGLSGKSLVSLVIPIVNALKREYPKCNVIAGGGINCQTVADLYWACHADHIAIGSAWLNPFDWSRLRRIS